MPQKARAAILEEPNKPLAIKDFPIPQPKNGSAVVRMEMAGVCGTDVHLWRGKLKIPYPVILGHETIATIHKLGEGLTRDIIGKELKKEDRVIYASAIPCGRCYYCTIAMEPTRCLNRKVYGVTLSSANPPHLFGGQAEYIYLLPGVYIFKLPDELPTEALVSFGCAAPTMIHAFEAAGGITPGDNVLIQGAGPVGLFALILAREAGSAKTIILDRLEKRLKVAKSLGADITINVDSIKDGETRRRKILDLTDGVGADVVFECTGDPKVVHEGWLMCRDSGKYVEVGHYTDRGSTELNPHHITRKQLKIVGSWGMTPRHYYKALKFIEGRWKKYRMDRLITHKFELDKATEALRTVEKGEAVKAVVVS